MSEQNQAPQQRRGSATPHSQVQRAFEGLAANSNRRGFLARVGAALTTVTAGGLVAKAVEPADAERYYGFCGHTYTTHPCPHPTGLPRIDSRGFPMRAADGTPIDDLGRPVNGKGQPLGDDHKLLRDPDGRPLPPAPRTKVCDETSRRFGMKTYVDGSWYRCCNGHVRKLQDCCSYNDTRINGDAALTGYCFSGRKVFCVMFVQTKVPC